MPQNGEGHYRARGEGDGDPAEHGGSGRQP